MRYADPPGAVADLLARAAHAQQEADDLIARRRAFTDTTRRPVDLLRRCYPATGLAVPWACAAITRLAEDALAQSQVEAVRLAVSEAVTDAIHAYKGAPGTVHFTAGLARCELIVLVAADGAAPRNPASRPGAAPGLAVIAEHTDQFAIFRRANGGTLTEMRWSLGATAPGDFPPPLVRREDTLPPPSLGTSPESDAGPAGIRCREEPLS